MRQSDKIGVSIICCTYNHVSYIKRALEGFVMQKTTFPVEILIHDDCSDDGTTEILREYSYMYPDKIRLILQQENQLSKGKNILKEYVYPLVRGEYIALCEGDDYWLDPNKLQKQYDVLEKNQDIDMCAHAVQIVYENSKKTRIIKRCKRNKVFSLSETIEGGGAFYATGTLMYRSQLTYELPSYFLAYPIDYAIQIQGAMRGGVIYLPDVMSAYRSGLRGSWSQRMRKDDSYRIREEKQLRQLLDLVDQETEGKYREIIELAFLEAQYSDLYFSGQYRPLTTDKYKVIYKRKSLWHKCKVLIKQKQSKMKNEA